MTLIPAAAPSQVARVSPVDEATRIPSLVRFRAGLLAAIARRDTARVIAAFSPRVRLSFGDASGHDELRRILRDETAWIELRDVLEHGGQFFSDTLFIAPYWFTARIDGDPFYMLVVIGSGVRVRERPGLDAPVIASLSHQAVLGGLTPAAEGWQPVSLADGRTGFVASQFVRSPVGYRAGIERNGETWHIVFFLAGD
jgi:hypothetical protein